MTFVANTVVETGGVRKSNATDTETHELLCQILAELKILNLHQSLSTNTVYTVNDTNN